MELKLFIETTLLDIMEGVRNAQSKCPEGAAVNPPVSNSGAKGTAAKTIDVTFDIEVGEETAESISPKIGVDLGIIKVGAGADEKGMERTTNRLSFSIPIRLPLSKGEDYNKNGVTFI